MSSRYIGHIAADIRREPESGKSVTLLLGLGDTSSDIVEAEITELGGEVTERLPFDTLEVEVPETAVSSICEMDGLQSIETDEELEDLKTGNPNSHLTSTR